MVIHFFHKMERDTQHRSYCFTLNNYTIAEEMKIQSLNCKYLIYGREKGLEGTPHLQGYIQYSFAKRFSVVKKDLGERCHIEPARGSAEDNIKYCSKDGDIFEAGSRPTQGKRSDLDDIALEIKAGKRLRDVIDDHPATGLRYIKQVERYVQLNQRPRTFFREKRREVIWLYGDAGVGKTRTAKKMIEEKGFKPDDVYELSCIGENRSDFLTGYTDEKVAILDDFRKGSLSFSTLLRITDPWNDCPINTKGGCAWWTVDLVIITCWKDYMAELADNRESMNQVKRRIKLVQVTKYGEEAMLTTIINPEFVDTNNRHDRDFNDEIERPLTPPNAQPLEDSYPVTPSHDFNF